MPEDKVEKVEHVKHYLMCHHDHDHAEGELKKLQKALNCEEVGYFDHTTHGALTEFQNRNDLPADGVLDEATAKALKLK